MAPPDAPLIPVYDPSEAPESVKNAVSMIPVDRVITRILANSPTFFQPVMTLISSCWAQTRIIRSSEWQTAVLRTAALLECPYEQQVNEPLASLFGFDDEAIACLRKGDLANKDRFSDRHRLISRIIEELVQYRQLLPATVVASNSLFTTEGTIEIITIHNAYSLVAQVMKSADVEEDPPIQHLHETLREFNKAAIEEERRQREEDSKTKPIRNSDQLDNFERTLKESPNRPYRAKAAAKAVEMSEKTTSKVVNGSPVANSETLQRTRNANPLEISVSAIGFKPQSDGTLSGLEYQVYELPRPAQGEVTIRWLFAPVNPQDILVLQNQYPVKPSYKTPGGNVIPGYDGLAKVMRIQGPTEAGFKEGDLVIPSPTKQGIGSWRTYANVSACELIRLPGISTPAPALSMLRMTYLVAYTLLQRCRLYPDDWIIANAGTSTIAQAIAVLGKREGIHTALVVRDRPSDALHRVSESLKALGADIVVTETQMEAPNIPEALEGKRIVLALDAVFGASASNLLKVLSPGAKLINYGTLSGGGPAAEMRLTSSAVFWKNIKVESFRSSEAIREIGEDKVRDLLVAFASWIDRGDLAQVDVEIVNWDQETTIRNIKRKRDQQTGGKLVLDLRQD